MMANSAIHSVAIIGAGISGVVSAGHLLANGIKVTVFERSQAAGGVWVYDKRVPVEDQDPNARPPDEEQSNKQESDKVRHNLEHAPPGPCYESLTNNVSTPLLRTKLNAWPEGTPRYVNHRVLKDYIQDTSRKAGVDDVTIFGALVTRVYKDEGKWHVSWTLLNENPQTGGLTEKTESGTYDAVIVASGHYHTPFIPPIPGLADAKTKWPSRITHSKSFRSSRGFEEKNVLLIGGGVSSVDIAREISPVAKHVYQSTRNGAFDIPASALPAGASRIEEVTALGLTNSSSVAGEHLPLVAHIQTGQTLKDIDRITLCTGYQMALPFLPQYNDPETSVSDANDTVIVTDGTQFHNLHQDIFYIPDPTLAFVGVPFYTATFTLFEFQAIAVTSVFSGIAKLPSTQAMKDEYRDRVQEKGYGRSFHSLRGEEQEYVRKLMQWVNNDRASHGLPSIEGHTSAWSEEKKLHVEKIHLLWQGIPQAEDAARRPSQVKVSA